MSILVIAEHDNTNLKGATLNTLAAAKEIGDEIIKGGRAETLYQHGWCHLHPSNADWSHLIH